MFRDNDILELEKLLISCQYLNELYIIIYNETYWGVDLFNWDYYLFEVLTKSSPTSLFKFKFYFLGPPELKSFILFLNNWKGRHPMLLQAITMYSSTLWHLNSDLIEKYKTQGIIEK